MPRQSMPAAWAIALFATIAPTNALAEDAQIDYMTAPYEIERVLDHGSRPDWSFDGTRLAFTEADTRNTPASEIDLATGEVRCLTCHLGEDRDVTRIYYLQDDSFLLLAPRRRDADGTRPSGQELYWMPATLGEVQPLEANAFGEIAISRNTGAGGTLIAWGDASTGKSLVRMARLVVEDGEASLLDTRTLYDSTEPPTLAGVTVAETYGFSRGDSAVTFYTIMDRGDTLDGEMVEVDIASGKVTSLYSDPSHNETHLFADERFGLEESNRASDPQGQWRGLSSHGEGFMAFMQRKVDWPLPVPETLRSYAPAGPNAGFNRPFDLYVVDREDPSSPRRLTWFSDLGAEAHQSVISHDGKRFAFALKTREAVGFAGRAGLYVGTFGESGDAQ
ncbi:hypothetical protein [Croceicoccus gelatinilyticus]|uniref:hypothetical protein n=1 Tax=Croceicoccus gelatinilyticus TaxID=2835536 RepID=UPI001BCEB4C9|nr:hypothetical protein [Croceicoccus gelatinilyticus]MBS7671177.1 hypothetical protein [Croceicoccus gelatinilyticus]